MAISWSLQKPPTSHPHPGFLLHHISVVTYPINPNPRHFPSNLAFPVAAFKFLATPMMPLESLDLGRRKGWEQNNVWFNHSSLPDFVMRAAQVYWFLIVCGYVGLECAKLSGLQVIYSLYSLISVTRTLTYFQLVLLRVSGGSRSTNNVAKS